MAGSTMSLGIVDNDQFALRALVVFLTKALSSSFSVSWLAEDPETSISKFTRKPTDVLLVDMSLGAVDGTQVIRAIRERDKRVRMIAITSFPLHEYAQDAAKAGAQGIAGKNDLMAMVALIRTVATGGTGLDVADAHFETPEMAFSRISGGVDAPESGLTVRESAIIELCSKGCTTSDIANDFGISEATVNTHIQRACKKLGARNRVHLVALWMQLKKPRH